MKKMFKVNKIMMILVSIIVLIGIVMMFTVGFNKAIEYRKGTKIEVSISKGYEINDIKEIAKETFQNKKVSIQKIEKLDQVFSVKLENYTEDELNNFKTKIAEKYELDSDKLDIEEVEVPLTRISTIVSPYILPVSLVTIFTIIYVAIRSIKNKNVIYNIFKLLKVLMLVAGLYFSIILITRIPVSEYTMPIALAVYVVTLLIGTVKILNRE